MDQASINQMANYVFNGITFSMLSWLILRLAYENNKTNINILDRHLEELKLYMLNRGDPLAEQAYRCVEGIKRYHEDIKLHFLPGDGFSEGFRKRKELTNLLAQV